MIPRLSARDLRVSRGSRLVLDGFTLEVAPGETVALLGPNGSGKTTALAALARLLGTGEVRVDGVPLVRPDPRRVACLFQEPPLPFALTVGELVSLGGPHVAAALAAVRLDPARAMARLSGGERQRAHLARCLAAGPAVLLLDEPTNHLDLAGRAALLGLLPGRTVVLATHDLDLAAAADRVLLLDAGRIVAVGPPAAVLDPVRLFPLFGAPLRRIDDPAGGPPALRVLPSPGASP